MAAITQAEVLDQGDCIALTFDKGQRLRFHALWLCDNALDEGTRSQTNGQRLITVGDLSQDIKIQSAEIKNDGLTVSLSTRNESLYFAGEWLLEHAYDVEDNKEPGWIGDANFPFDQSLRPDQFTKSLLDVKSDPKALSIWLGYIQKYGVAKLVDCPIKAGALNNIVALFWLCQRDQLRQMVRGTNRAQSQQSRLHQPWPSGPHRQSLS